MIQAKQFIYFSLILLTLAVSGWFYNQNSSTPLTMQLENLPDFSMENVVATQFTEEGKLSQRIYTPKLIHYKKNDASFFVKPRMFIYKTNEAPWQIDAEKGQSIFGTTQIILQQKVLLHQPAMIAQNQETTVRTEILNVFPQRKYAETQLPITLIQPGLTIDSVGMRAYMQENKVELLSQAKGHYAN